MADTPEIAKFVGIHKQLREYAYLLEQMPQHIEENRKWIGFHKIEYFLCSTLRQHFSSEEEHMFPAALEKSGKAEARLVVDRMLKEHAEILQQIASFEDIVHSRVFPLDTKDAAALNDIARDLERLFLSHVEAEDKHIFPLYK
jgi:iron-sulfur cluster repair protein YtfE (RIC family)